MPVNSAPTDQEVANPFDFESAQSAYEAIKGRLGAIKRSETLAIRSPLLSIMSTVKYVAAYIQQPIERERFAALPGLDISNVDDLGQFAAAYWYSRVRLKTARGQKSRAVPIALADEGAELKERLYSLLEYHLSGVPTLKLELEEIRSGRGYEDLSSDLVRLAELHVQYREEIELDPRNYAEADASTARALALDILGELTSNEKEQDAWALESSRCATLLDRAYREVSSAATWLYRTEPDVSALFRSLHSVGRTRQAPTESNVSSAQSGERAASVIKKAM